MNPVVPKIGFQYNKDERRETQDVRHVDRSYEQVIGPNFSMFNDDESSPHEDSYPQRSNIRMSLPTLNSVPKCFVFIPLFC